MDAQIDLKLAEPSRVSLARENGQGFMKVRRQTMPAFHSLRPGDRFTVKVFKALSDGTRQEILQILEKRDRNVSEIVSNFNLTQPTISRHLKVLSNVDLVTRERIGKNMVYSLNDEALSDSMLQFFARFRGCGRVLR